MEPRHPDPAQVAHAPRGRGFSLLELVVVVCIVAVLAAFGAERLLRYAEYAERARMEFTISALKSAMGMRYAALYLRGKDADLLALRDENPMEWLSDRPVNYIGALWEPALPDVPEGSWYFERGKRHLVYLPARTRNLVPPRPGDPRIRFVVRVEFTEQPASLGGRSELSVLTIDPVVPYEWLKNPPTD